MSRDLHMRTAWVQTHPIESLTIRVERTLEATWISPGISSLKFSIKRVMKCCIYLLAIFVEQAEKMTLVALEGSAYPSELCPKGCKRDENGIFSNILATKQKWVKLAIFWSVWDIVGCISWNDVKKSIKPVKPSNQICSPSFSFLFQGLLSMSSTAAKSKCFARNL